MQAPRRRHVCLKISEEFTCITWSRANKILKQFVLRHLRSKFCSTCPREVPVVRRRERRRSVFRGTGTPSPTPHPLATTASLLPFTESCFAPRPHTHAYRPPSLFSESVLQGLLHENKGNRGAKELQYEMSGLAPLALTTALSRPFFFCFGYCRSLSITSHNNRPQYCGGFSVSAWRTSLFLSRVEFSRGIITRLRR